MLLSCHHVQITRYQVLLLCHLVRTGVCKECSQNQVDIVSGGPKATSQVVMIASSTSMGDLEANQQSSPFSAGNSRTKQQSSPFVKFFSTRSNFDWYHATRSQYPLQHSYFRFSYHSGLVAGKCPSVATACILRDTKCYFVVT